MARKESIEERRDAIAARKAAKEAARRVVQYPLRLNAAERAQLDAKARLRGLSPADLLRASFLDDGPGGGAPGQTTEGLAAASVPLLAPADVAALNRVGANINQIARRINASMLVEPNELPGVLKSLEESLTRIEALVFASMDN